MTQQQLSKKPLKAKPDYIRKLEESIAVLGEQLENQQKLLEQSTKQFKYIEKTVKRILTKCPTEAEPKKRQNGFAKPRTITDQLAEFMQLPVGSLVSRTQATQYIMQYIKTNGLENPADRRKIIPNDSLWAILGDDARMEQAITHFNLQKYVTRHFV